MYYLLFQLIDYCQYGLRSLLRPLSFVVLLQFLHRFHFDANQLRFRYHSYFKRMESILTREITLAPDFFDGLKDSWVGGLVFFAAFP